MSGRGTLLLDRAKQTQDEPVAKFCDPVRVQVIARGPRFPGNLDASGRALFCKWKLFAAAEGSSGPAEGVERVRGADRLEVWTDPGSVYLRAGGQLYLSGGNNGNTPWSVEVFAVKEVQREPEQYWLTAYSPAEVALVEWPPGATHFRLLHGTARFNTEVIVPRLEYPIALAGAPDNVFVHGVYQVGTVVP
ncbi:MAG TPA: hypothetical protein VLS89_18530 [Candidatus Nanopelagicales bacterium]|nr:hypothetical protein [Candidatus Nanopelagicales bacterium]